MPKLTQHNDKEKKRNQTEYSCCNKPHSVSLIMNPGEKVKGQTLCEIHVITAFRFSDKFNQRPKNTFTSSTSSTQIIRATSQVLSPPSETAMLGPTVSAEKLKTSVLCRRLQTAG